MSVTTIDGFLAKRFFQQKLLLTSNTVSSARAFSILFLFNRPFEWIKEPPGCTLSLAQRISVFANNNIRLALQYLL